MAPATCSTAPMSIPISPNPARAGTITLISRAQPRPTRSSTSAMKQVCRPLPTSRRCGRNFRSMRDLDCFVAPLLAMTTRPRCHVIASEAKQSSSISGGGEDSHGLLNQRRLQIETGVGHLSGIDRPVEAEKLPAEHVVAGAIDGLDADELARLVAKGRKRARVPIAAHHDLVVTGGEARNLELVVALIAPEPWQAVIDLGIAGQPRRHAARLIGGILHGLKPKRAAKTRTCEQGTVADRRNIGIGGQQMLVDDDARCDRKPGFRSKFDIRQDADADHDQIRRDVAAVAEADTRNLVAVGFDGGCLHAKVDMDAGGSVPFLKVVGYFARDRARHDAAAELDHIDLEALGPRG